MEGTMMESKMTEGTMTGMMNMPMMGGMGMQTGATNMMIPRCTMKMEQCEGGMRMMCTSSEELAVGMMQSLCKMMMGGMASMCMMMNGMMVMNCNMTMGMCKMEMMADGIMMTCTSGDSATCAMIQACCDCMMAMMNCGCTCCMTMNNMPICCSC